MIRWIRNAEFLQYRFKRTRTYLGRFSNALVDSQRKSSRSARCAITNLYWHLFTMVKNGVIIIISLLLQNTLAIFQMAN